MGWYYALDESAIVPDGFLSLGVPRVKGENLRLSYVTWEENGTIPSLALEVVSKTPGGEYKEKKRKYAQCGVLYYVIYAPLRRHKPKLTIYRLNSEGRYELQDDNPLWMPEIGLGIGTEVGSYQGITREWLYWYDEQGKRYLTPEEAERQAQLQRRYAERRQRQERQARQQAEERQEQAEREAQRERERAEQLAARLRELGIDPERLN